jgi:hypothetical protein
MSIDRRDFLKVVGSASFAGGLAGIGSRSAAAAVADFGFADDQVPMNAANLCPMPTRISLAQARYAAELDRSLSTATRHAVEGHKETARAKIAAMLGTNAGSSEHGAMVEMCLDRPLG